MRRDQSRGSARGAGDTPEIPTGSPISDEGLRYWRAELVRHAREISRDVQQVEEEVNPPEREAKAFKDPPEDGSEMQTIGNDIDAVARDAEILRLIQRALTKIDTGRPFPFGVCERTLRPIELDRLELIPWTPFSVAGSQLAEREHLTVDDLEP